MGGYSQPDRRRYLARVAAVPLGVRVALIGCRPHPKRSPPIGPAPVHGGGSVEARAWPQGFRHEQRDVDEKARRGRGRRWPGRPRDRLAQSPTVGYGISRRNDHAAPFDGPDDGLPLKIRMRYRVFGGSVADASPLSHVVAVPLTRHESTIALASTFMICKRRPPVPAPGAESSRPDQVPDFGRGVRGDAPIASRLPPGSAALYPDGGKRSSLLNRVMRSSPVLPWIRFAAAEPCGPCGPLRTDISPLRPRGERPLLESWGAASDCGCPCSARCCPGDRRCGGCCWATWRLPDLRDRVGGPAERNEQRQQSDNQRRRRPTSSNRTHSHPFVRPDGVWSEAARPHPGFQVGQPTLSKRAAPGHSFASLVRPSSLGTSAQIGRNRSESTGRRSAPGPGLNVDVGRPQDLAASRAVHLDLRDLAACAMAPETGGRRRPRSSDHPRRPWPSARRRTRSPCASGRTRASPAARSRGGAQHPGVDEVLEPVGEDLAGDAEVTLDVVEAVDPTQTSRSTSGDQGSPATARLRAIEQVIWEKSVRCMRRAY